MNNINSKRINYVKYLFILLLLVGVFGVFSRSYFHVNNIHLDGIKTGMLRREVSLYAVDALHWKIFKRSGYSYEQFTFNKEIRYDAVFKINEKGELDNDVLTKWSLKKN
jgi:hypothetical protein